MQAQQDSPFTLGEVVLSAASIVVTSKVLSFYKVQLLRMSFTFDTKRQNIVCNQ
jgi:hypothetical protein